MSKGKSKTKLVAQREILENVRTKTFWIGILSFPVILVASILIPTWFQKKVDVRTFGVEDRSGWLSAAIEKRLEMPDFDALTKLLLDKDAEPSLPKDLRQSTLGQFLQAFAKVGAKQLKEKQSLNSLLPTLLDTLESSDLGSLLEKLPISLPIPKGKAKEGIKTFFFSTESFEFHIHAHTLAWIV